MRNKSLQKAFVLHTRPYRETSTLVELFTQESGRISALAKGSRHSKSTVKGLLQPFTPVFVKWGGRGSLKTLHIIEPSYPFLYLKPNTIRIGLYLNELLMYTLPQAEKNETLFRLYEDSLKQINAAHVEETLRRFEKKLLKELGYAINFSSEANTKKPILPDSYYHFSPFGGFIKTSNTHPLNFSGNDLIAISNEDYSSTETLKAAKRLFKLALEPLLEGKTVKTRELFVLHGD